MVKVKNWIFDHILFYLLLIYLLFFLFSPKKAQKVPISFIWFYVDEKFNSEIDFGEKELISLLYYLGYLTIKNNEFGILQFGIPNEIIRQIYIEKYRKTEEIQAIPKLRSYTAVAIKDKLIVEEI